MTIIVAINENPSYEGLQTMDSLKAKSKRLKYMTFLALKNDENSSYKLSHKKLNNIKQCF